MKRLFSFVSVFTLLFAALPVHTVRAAGADDLVKCPDFSAVYYVGDDGNRYVFPNENIYFSWFPDFSEVKTVSCDDLASFPIGDRLVYQPGTSLVKIPSDPSVYVVESDGVLREIPDEDTAEALFGDDWSERVDDVSEAFWPSFTVGEPLEEGEVPEGTVLEDEDGNLFRVDDDGSATEVDAVLDTDDEEVLETYALSLEEIQTRLGIAMALTRVDSESAIAVLEQLLADLKPVHVDDEDVDEVDEIDDEDDNEGDADDAISDAKEEIAEAVSDIAEDEADGKDITASEALLVSAREHLALAEAAYAAGDFQAAEEHADEAKHDAMWARGKAVDSIDDEDEDEDESEDDEEESEDADEDGDEDTDEKDADTEDTSDDEASDEDAEDSDADEDNGGSSDDSEDDDTTM